METYEKVCKSMLVWNVCKVNKSLPIFIYILNINKN